MYDYYNMYKKSFKSSTQCKALASFPGSSRFSNVARKKRREPGKIYHMSDVGWKGLRQAARA